MKNKKALHQLLWVKRSVSWRQGLEITGTIYQGLLRRATGRSANSLRSDSAGRLSSRAPKRP